MKKLTFAFLLCLTAFNLASFAQWGGAMGSTWNNPISAMSNIQMWGNINSNFNNRMSLKSSLRKYGCTDAQMDAMDNTELMIALGKKTCSFKRTDRNGSSPAGSTAQNSGPAPISSKVPPITFQPSGGRILLPQIVAGISQDPSEQKALIKLLGGAIDDFETAQRARGSEYDLASAMSFLASISIYLQDTKMEINSAGGDALTLALREALGSKMASISNTDKQQFYEASLSLAMIFALLSRNADANTLEQLKQTSAETCRTLMGLDVTKYRITANGLVSVK